MTYLYSLLTIVVCEFNNFLAIVKDLPGYIFSHLIWHEKLCSCSFEKEWTVMTICFKLTEFQTTGNSKASYPALLIFLAF